jgi:hypothetical protein
LVGCGEATEPASSNALTVTGSIEVPRAYDGTDDTPGKVCVSEPGYEDIGSGTQVVIVDETGTKVGSTPAPK